MQPGARPFLLDRADQRPEPPADVVQAGADLRLRRAIARAVLDGHHHRLCHARHCTLMGIRVEPPSTSREGWKGPASAIARSGDATCTLAACRLRLHGSVWRKSLVWCNNAVRLSA